MAAEEDWPGGDFAVCKMTDEAGNTGLGEQFVWWPETGVSPNQIIIAIQEALYKYVLGRIPFDYKDIRTHMNNNVARNETAKGLLDMAIRQFAEQHSLITELINNFSIYC
jgi:muconate cycloisomerase